MAKAKLKPVSAGKPGSIQRSMLLDVLTKVKAAVDKSGSTGIEQAQHFIIDDNRVMAYNDRISISAPLKRKTGLHLTVQAEDLFKVVSDIAEDVIELSEDENGNLVVSSSSTNAWLSSLPLEGDLLDLVKSLKLDKIKEGDWQNIPEDFIEGLKLCGFSVSKDAANVAYSSIYVDSDGMGDAKIYSTDNFRISRYMFDTCDAAVTFLMQFESTQELSKYEFNQIQQSGAWVHFRGEDGLTFSARTVNADFPDCSKFFKVKGEKIKLPPEIAPALKQSLVFSPGEDVEQRSAYLQIKNNQVIVKSENSRGGIERSVSVPGLKVKGFPKLQINPNFFLDILQRATSMTVSENRALFSSGNFEHVMVLPADEGESTSDE